jgi:peptidoglycan/LPS O-acetylase OafA/YrhL
LVSNQGVNAPATFESEPTPGCLNRSLPLVAAGFFLAEALRRRRGLKWVAWPCRIGGVLTLALLIFDGVLAGADLGGLGERLIAFVVAAELALLAVVVAGVAKSTSVQEVVTTADNTC